MILQSLQLPKLGICDNEQMYVRANDSCIVNANHGECIFSVGGKLSFNTYFNSFSIGKWKKYTSVNNVQLALNYSGHFTLSLFHASIINNNLFRKKISEHDLESSENTSCCFEISTTADDGILYFELVALKDNSVFLGGCYKTEDLDYSGDINLAIGICTFKREEFIQKNIHLLEDTIINNSECPVYNHIEIFISDNSQTLSNSYESKSVHIYKNKNLGGSGGFTRAILEILKKNDNGRYSHILLMDDDIIINPDSIILTYNFLNCLKPEYKEAFIGGHMLNNDRRYIQSEAADYFDSVNHHPVKPQYNLEQEEWLIKNEIEDSINYLSWWYCCMPLNLITPDNLPFPFFIKRDDIEYGLRNGTIFITLNGICVWHEPFEYKTSAHLDYYYFRNLCIMLSVHKPHVSKYQLIKLLVRHVIKSLFTFRYKNAEFSLWGIQDFLKGFDWFKAQDGEQINKALMKHNYQKIPLSSIPWVFQYGNYRKSLSYDEGRLKRIIRWLSLNGLIFKSKKSVIVPVYQPHPGLFFRAKRALNYEDISKTGFLTNKDPKAFFILIKELIHEVISIVLHYDSVKNEYRNRYKEITNIKYWEEYLTRNGDPVEYHSKLPLNGRPPIKLEDILKLLGAYLLLFSQWILFFIPVKKNRIMIYNHDRKGFTCNPKYIMQALIAQYPVKYEIYWVTKFPETCQDHPKDVHVIRANSAKHILKYIRTRIYITNDCFPAWAAHFKRHKWLNTWHGAINYKHIGFDYIAPMSTVKFKWFKLCNRQPDYFLSASEFFTEDTSKSFYFDKSCFLEYGFPRNDLFFHDIDSNDIRQKVREKLGIEQNKKIVLFAPTFRRGMKTSFYGLDFVMLCNSLEKRFGGDWIVLFRNHNFVKKQRKINGVIDVSSYDDMNELLVTSDILISDYSSCMYDFSLQYKPCFVYAPDIDFYRKNDRDFAYPPEKWPFSIAKTNEELQHNIMAFDEGTWQQKLKNHFSDAGSRDDGEATARVTALIEKWVR